MYIYETAYGKRLDKKQYGYIFENDKLEPLPLGFEDSQTKCVRYTQLEKDKYFLGFYNVFNGTGMDKRPQGFLHAYIFDEEAAKELMEDPFNVLRVDHYDFPDEIKDMYAKEWQSWEPLYKNKRIEIPPVEKVNRNIYLLYAKAIFSEAIDDEKIQLCHVFKNQDPEEQLISVLKMLSLFSTNLRMSVSFDTNGDGNSYNRQIDILGLTLEMYNSLKCSRASKIMMHRDVFTEQKVEAVNTKKMEKFLCIYGGVKNDEMKSFTEQLSDKKKIVNKLFERAKKQEKEKQKECEKREEKEHEWEEAEYEITDDETEDKIFRRKHHDYIEKRRRKVCAGRMLQLLTVLAGIVLVLSNIVITGRPETALFIRLRVTPDAFLYIVQAAVITLFCWLYRKAGEYFRK